MPLCRSLLFYLGLILSTLFFSPLAILIFPLPFKLRFLIVSRWAVFNLWWLKITCGLTHTIEGQENIPDTPAIIMCKHQSAWETLAIQLIFPSQVWILKRELLWIPIYGWGLASMQPIAIDRSSVISSLRQIVEQGCKRLAQGIWVVVFPEGTRVAPGEKGKYLPGGSLLAEKSGCPIVPIAHNSGYFWPRNSITKRPGTINMIIGPVIESSGKSANDISSEVEEWIETTMQRLPTPATSQSA
ncbi:MAG: lysophospholipid acyltransferase family protein [Gammaproteobacteria bacterium]